MTCTFQLSRHSLVLVCGQIYRTYSQTWHTRIRFALRFLFHVPSMPTWPAKIHTGVWLFHTPHQPFLPFRRWPIVQTSLGQFTMFFWLGWLGCWAHSVFSCRVKVKLKVWNKEPTFSFWMHPLLASSLPPPPHRSASVTTSPICRMSVCWTLGRSPRWPGRRRPVSTAFREFVDPSAFLLFSSLSELRYALSRIVYLDMLSKLFVVYVLGLFVYCIKN